jgi:hypothetical protein
MYSRIPKRHDRAGDRQPAWELDDDLELRPSLSNALLQDEAWEVTSNLLGLIPRLSFITDDFWELDINGDLQPVEA